MNNAHDMSDSKLAEIVSKFEMPAGKYVVKKHDEFGESEFYWIIENQDEHLEYLLVNTYWHPGIEKEINFYKENGIFVKKPILRKFKTLEVATDKDDPIRKYLFYDLYALFLI